MTSWSVTWHLHGVVWMSSSLYSQVQVTDVHGFLLHLHHFYLFLIASTLIEDLVVGVGQALFVHWLIVMAGTGRWSIGVQSAPVGIFVGTSRCRIVPFSIVFLVGIVHLGCSWSGSGSLDGIFASASTIWYNLWNDLTWRIFAVFLQSILLFLSFCSTSRTSFVHCCRFNFCSIMYMLSINRRCNGMACRPVFPMAIFLLVLYIWTWRMINLWRTGPVDASQYRLIGDRDIDIFLLYMIVHDDRWYKSNDQVHLCTSKIDLLSLYI